MTVKLEQALEELSAPCGWCTHARTRTHRASGPVQHLAPPLAPAMVSDIFVFVHTLTAGLAGDGIAWKQQPLNLQDGPLGLLFQVLSPLGQEKYRAGYCSHFTSDSAGRDCRSTVPSLSLSLLTCKAWKYNWEVLI